MYKIEPGDGAAETARILRRGGVCYRSRPKLPGSPGFVVEGRLPVFCDGPFRRGLGTTPGAQAGPYKTSGYVISQRAPADWLKALAACAAVSVLLAVSQSGAQLASPLAQEEAGTAPDEVLCNEGLVLVIRASGAACLRPATADRLGLEIILRSERHGHADAPAVSDGALADSDAAEPVEIKAHALVPAPDFKPAIQHPGTGERLECVWEQCYAVSPSSETYAGLHGAQCSRHGKCFVVSDVPPPKEREPLVFLAYFKGEPIRTTIMVDPDRTGYWSTATKAELDELLPKIAGALGPEIHTHLIIGSDPYVLSGDEYDWLPAALGAGFENTRWRGSGLPVAGDDFDFHADQYEYKWHVRDGWFTAHNGLDGGKIHHQRYSSVPGSPTSLEFAAEFMDTMGFDNWAPYVGKVWGSGMIHGTVLDQTADLKERYETTGPTVQQVTSFIQDARGDPELNPERMTDSVRHVRDNYGLYKDAIFDRFETDHIPLIAYNDGTGWISVGPVPDGLTGDFEGWSDYPIPKPAVSRTEAIERALEFAAADPVLSGPECALSVQDRSAENRPRYVYLDQVAGAPFWVVDMGACEVRHDLCHAGDIASREDLLTMEESRAIVDAQWDMTDGQLDDWVDDPSLCRQIWEDKTEIRITPAGWIDSAGMGKAPYMPYHHSIFNHAHEVNVDVFVDALDGQTAWFRENEEWDSDIRWRNSFFEDENVWFLEDGKVTFASKWPKGYIYETVWLTDELMR